MCFAAFAHFATESAKDMSHRSEKGLFFGSFIFVTYPDIESLQLLDFLLWEKENLRASGHLDVSSKAKAKDEAKGAGCFDPRLVQHLGES